MPYYPGAVWEAVDPEDNHWRADLLLRAQAAAMEFGTIGAVVVHRGKIVASGGAVDEKVRVRSLRKSFLSALIGIEVKRGRIRLDDRLEELNIDDVEGLSDIERQATVRHLLQARSGVYHPALAESKEMRAQGKPRRSSKIPGTHWLYNNWDFNALGTIYERATGHSVFEGLYRDIAVPIGMEDFIPSDGAYFRGRESIHPAYHMKMTSRDLARFGWLYLNGGSWKGQQIVPKDWVLDSVKAHSYDGTNGYGYMWWTTGHNGEAQSEQPSIYRTHLPAVRYFAHGHHGQMIAVFPEKEVVIAHLAQSRQRSPEEKTKVWKFISHIMEAHDQCNTPPH